MDKELGDHFLKPAQISSCSSAWLLKFCSNWTNILKNTGARDNKIMGERINEDNISHLRTSYYILTGKLLHMQSKKKNRHLDVRRSLINKGGNSITLVNSCVKDDWLAGWLKPTDHLSYESWAHFHTACQPLILSPATLLIKLNKCKKNYLTEHAIVHNGRNPKPINYS